MKTLTLVVSDDQSENIKQYVELLNRNRGFIEGPVIQVIEMDAQLYLRDIDTRIKNINRVMSR